MEVDSFIKAILLAKVDIYPAVVVQATPTIWVVAINEIKSIKYKFDFNKEA